MTTSQVAELALQILLYVFKVSRAVADASSVRLDCIAALLAAEVDPDSSPVIAKAKRFVNVDGLAVEQARLSTRHNPSWAQDRPNP